jgi:hypothetical protein
MYVFLNDINQIYRKNRLSHILLIRLCFDDDNDDDDDDDDDNDDVDINDDNF